MKKASFKINGLSCDTYSETAKDICSYSYNGAWAQDIDQEEIPRVKKPPPRRESGYFVK